MRAVKQWGVEACPGPEAVAALLPQVLGHSDTLAYERWPPYDEALLVQDTINLPVQARVLAYARMRAQALRMHGTLRRFAQVACCCKYGCWR
jgi:leucyl-tRNA synthetase